MSSVVRASHLLCKHTESRNPVSRRTGSQITLSKADARVELEQIRSALSGAEDLPRAFAEAALSRSDCGSFRNGGDLGEFGRGAMQKPFEDGAYALRVGEMGQIVDSDSGPHIILRTA